MIIYTYICVMASWQKRVGLARRGFVSLAPKTSGFALDVIRWDLNGSARLVASLGNAHHPQMIGGGVLGYVGESLSADGTTFGAMVVNPKANPVLPGLLDKWAVHTVDLGSGNVTAAPLTPQPSLLGAETTALAGFGLA